MQPEFEELASALAATQAARGHANEDTNNQLAMLAYRQSAARLGPALAMAVEAFIGSRVGPASLEPVATALACALMNAGLMPAKVGYPLLDPPCGPM